MTPNRSGFSLSHEHLTTMPVGTLVPFCWEMMPNTDISLGALANVELPPFATDFNGKIDLRLEAFFVPCRQLWLGFKDFITRQNLFEQGASFPTVVPRYLVNSSRLSIVQNANIPTLEDYLGMHSATQDYVSALPFLAYHKVFQDWYQDRRVQKALFVPSDIQANSLANLPFTRGNSSIVFNGQESFYNGSKLYDLHQRNYDRDFFTTAQLTATAGNDEAVEIVDDAFTISALRQANALQRFSEILGQVGNDYGRYMKAMYGKYPSAEKTQRAIYLGSARQRLYSAGIDQSISSEQGADMELRNPFSKQLGGSAGQIGTTMESSLVGKFTTDEHGYLLVMASIVPIAFYSNLKNLDLFHLYHADFANQKFAGMGNVPIKSSMLSPSGVGTFGWTDRYSEYKFKNSVVSGAFREAGWLQYFSLKRHFTGSPQLNSSFLEIPQTALDEVLAVTEEGRDYPVNFARLNIGFKFNVVQPLPVYSIPTLEDHQHGQHVQMVQKAGTHI